MGDHNMGDLLQFMQMVPGSDNLKIGRICGASQADSLTEMDMPNLQVPIMNRTFEYLQKMRLKFET